MNANFVLLSGCILVIKRQKYARDLKIYQKTVSINTAVAATTLQVCVQNHLNVLLRYEIMENVPKT